MTAAPALTPVAGGLYRLDTFVSGTLMPLAMYLVESVDAGAYLLTDTGCVGMVDSLVLPALDELRPGAAVQAAVVCHAHADHFGGNAELLEANPSCRIYAHRGDVAWARDPARHVRESYDGLGADYETPQEVKDWVANLLGPPTPVTALEAGDRFELADGACLEALHLPGHSPGHIGLWDQGHGVLLASDAILGDGQWAGGRLDAIPSYLDVADYLRSIRTVRDLDAEVLCTAHFPVMRGAEIRAFCGLSEDFVARLDEAVRAVMAAGSGWTLRRLTTKVMPMVAPGVNPSVTAAFSVKAHLDDLLGRGEVVLDARDPARSWRLA